MNIPKLVAGGAIVATTVAISGASAFAATPTQMPHLAPGTTILSRADAAKGHGPFVKIQANVAQVLDLTTDQLKAELQTKTLDQIAAEHGMTRSQLMEQALKNAGFSDAQIQRVMNAIAKAPHNQNR